MKKNGAGGDLEKKCQRNAATGGREANVATNEWKVKLTDKCGKKRRRVWRKRKKQRNNKWKRWEENKVGHNGAKKKWVKKKQKTKTSPVSVAKKNTKKTITSQEKENGQFFGIFPSVFLLNERELIVARNAIGARERRPTSGKKTRRPVGNRRRESLSGAEKKKKAPKKNATKPFLEKKKRTSEEEEEEEEEGHGVETRSRVPLSVGRNRRRRTSRRRTRSVEHQSPSPGKKTR